VEFDDLNKAVQHLLDRNRKIFLAQKEFIENASHELQTPLAIFQAKLDILMQQPALQEADATTIQELVETAQRMARLNKDLLLLSKIDNDQFIQREEIELSVIVNALIKDLTPVAAVENIAIQSKIKPVSVHANKSLMEILISNLVYNGVRYSLTNGNIIVKLEDNIFFISNTRPALRMPPENIFDRFTKEGNTGNSTGLGLAIAKKICEVHDFKLTYMYADNAHQFTVTF
jgi:signal transduction histidine kinase